MADETKPKMPFFHTPLGMIVAAFILWAIAGAAKVIADYYVAQHADIPTLQKYILWYIPGYGIALFATVFFLLGIIRLAVYGPAGLPKRNAAEGEETLRLLRSINDRMLISDTAKRLAHREKDREELRAAIRDDIHKHEFEAAMVLVTQMSQTYGYRQEAEDFRDEIMRARAAETASQIRQAISRFEAMLEKYEWDNAAQEAAKIQRLYPDAPQVRDLGKRVREAREQHKHDLERKFLQASERDDVEGAMELLKELDKHLTEAEAGPFRETARGVIGKKRANLGVQFKMAVHDKEWTAAVRVGEQIIRDFPNTKMSDEVRGLIDLLRERAAGEQAARPREMA